MRSVKYATGNTAIASRAVTILLRAFILTDLSYLKMLISSFCPMRS